MSRIFFLLALGFLLSCNESDSSGAENLNMDSIGREAMADSTSYTTIRWIDSVNQNIGEIRKGGKTEIVWRFRNEGDKPLIISSVTAGCGCTVAQKPTRPIAPGEEDVIKASFDTQNQGLGMNSKSMTVMANTTGTSVHYLTFTAMVTE